MNKVYCLKCMKEIPEFDKCIQFIFVVNNKTVEYVDLDLTLDYINLYLNDHPCHLSASEILLLRVDVTTEILKIYYPDLRYWGLTGTEVCNDCYKGYAKAHPLL